MVSGRLAGGKLEFELTLTRHNTPVNPNCKSYAKLIAGSLHDDCLLLHEPLVLEQFPSPYTAKFATRAPLPADSPAVHVVASVILDRLIGLDVTKKVTVPRTAKLQNGVPISAPEQPQSDTACTLSQQQQPQQPQQQRQQQRQQQSQPEQQQQHGSAGTAWQGSKQSISTGLLQPSPACPPEYQHQPHTLTTQVPQTAWPELVRGHGQASTSSALPAAGGTESWQTCQQPGEGAVMPTPAQGKTEPGAGGRWATAKMHQGSLKPFLAAQTGSGPGPSTQGVSHGASANGVASTGVLPQHHSVGGSSRVAATTTAHASENRGKPARRKLVHTISLPPVASSNSGPAASHAPARLHNPGCDRPEVTLVYDGTEQVCQQWTLAQVRHQAGVPSAGVLLQ